MDGDDEDGWDTALGYLDACGPGYHLQIARTTSMDKHLGASMKSSSGSLGNFLMDDSQKEKVWLPTLESFVWRFSLATETLPFQLTEAKPVAAGPSWELESCTLCLQSELKEQAEMDATKSLVSVARKARDLYERQQKIEKDVQQR